MTTEKTSWKNKETARKTARVWFYLANTVRPE